MVVVKTVLVLSLFIILLIMRLPLPITLLAAGLLTALSNLIPPWEIMDIARATLVDLQVWEVVFAIYFILLLSTVFQKFEVFTPVFRFLSSKIRDRRLILPVFPALIGMLPMLGGAVFSAPFVEEAARGLKLTGEQKTFFNYWFRHIWEYFFPLYSGIILLMRIMDISLGDVVRHQWYMTAVALVYGMAWLFFTVKPGNQEAGPGASFSASLRSVFPALFPFVIILAGVFVKELNFAVLIFLASVPYSVCLCHYRKESFLDLARKAFSLKMFFLILAVFFFKRMIEFSGMAGDFQSWSADGGFPPQVLLFLLPFLMGLLTGVTNAYVGISFPLLLPFLRQGGSVDYAGILFAYTAGFSGVLLSPVHLCFLLTNEYFRSSMWRIYPPILLGVIILLGVSLCPMLL